MKIKMSRDRVKQIIQEVIQEDHPVGAHRHLAYLMDNLGTLDNVAQVLELVAEDIRHALTLIGKITGSVGVEEVLDNLFKNFCIGK